MTTVDPMEPQSTIATFPTFRMWLRPDGIVQMDWAPRIATGLVEALEAVETMTRITGGRRSPLLVSLLGAGPQDRAARAEFACRDDVVSAVALIVGTPLSRVIGNFYLSVNRPIAPTRLFDDEPSAVAWLHGFVDQK
jgi:hypothetical protein